MSNTVNVHTEWGTLKQVIVGDLRDATFPAYEPFFGQFYDRTIQRRWQDGAFHSQAGTLKTGAPFPQTMIKHAQAELDNLAKTLTELGIVVHRPNRAQNPHAALATPYWQLPQACYVGNPRDVLLVLGDTIIEAPMAARGRSFEKTLYRQLCRSLFEQGARWLSPPAPMLEDSLYCSEPGLTEIEPVFDAASIAKCGKDLFILKDLGINYLGIEWLKRHFPQYHIHLLATQDTKPLHIDTTLILLAPGKALLNKAWCPVVPEALKNWDVRDIPPAHNDPEKKFTTTSPNLYVNLLSVDEKRVIVEESECYLIDFLADWGFEPIPIPFKHHYPFGGGIHCATLDLYREDQCIHY